MSASGKRTLIMMQTLVDGPYSMLRIPIVTIQESDLKHEDLSIFDHCRPIGVSPGYSASGALVALAISDDENCRIIEFSDIRTKNHSNGRARGRSSPPSDLARQALQDIVLCRREGDLVAFDLAPLALSLYHRFKARITNGVDLQSAFSAVNRRPLIAIKDAVGDTIRIMEDNITSVFRNTIYDQDDRNRLTDLAMRAWVSQFITGLENGLDAFTKAPRVDTKKLDLQTLDIIAKLNHDTLRLNQNKPSQVKRDFTHTPDGSNGRPKISSNSYNNKVRSGQNVRVKTDAGYSLPGHIGDTRGRSAALDLAQTLPEGRRITSLITIGRDDPTTADARRASAILRILQGHTDLLTDNPWLKNIWFPRDDGLMIWPDDWSLDDSAAPPDGNLGRHNLNDSQQRAAQDMLSTASHHRLCLIQGPPGTGKTYVIATFVQVALDAGHKGIWLVAQSNVAVKNIAEKLAAVGIENWRLLVSKDFHLEWHEHLYAKIQSNIIRSDDFQGVFAKLHGCNVILCTLSMLSNPNIHKFTRPIPVKTLVVDEASQIEIGDYISAFSQFRATLRKVCFIGDDKQLPPFGQEDLQDLQGIFEISHLQSGVVFLNTQYRMPPQIGGFISEMVYEGKLNSNPYHPISDNVIACHFIDVDGKERMHQKSFVNDQECQAVLKMAQHLQDRGKAYRIITPYEAQTKAVESAMKNQGLEWGDKCFNVDSFQGNEDDYIIISLVRSRKIGFLENLRRTNVMLTRCKRGMFIISSSTFLNGVGANTLVGKLAQNMGEKAWLMMKDVEDGNF